MSITSDPALLVNQLPIAVEFPEDPKQLIETLSLLYKRIANSVNTKTGGLFSQQELFDSEQYSLGTPVSFKNVYRKVFDMVSLNGGNIAPGATTSFPHNITGITKTTAIYGSATNSDPKYLPLPYVSVTAINQQIEIYLTPTNVVLINGAAQTALTSATIVAEYIKT